MPSPEEHREEALAKEAWGGGNGAGSSRLVGLEGNFGKLPLVGVTVGGRMGFAVGLRRGSAVGFTVGCGMGFAVGLAATLGLSSRTRAFSWLSVAAGFCCCTIGSFVGFRLGCFGNKIGAVVVPSPRGTGGAAASVPGTAADDEEVFSWASNDAKGTCSCFTISLTEEKEDKVNCSRASTATITARPSTINNRKQLPL